MATVLVTGGTGTLGREVVKHLLLKQYRTRILSRQSSPPVPPGVEVITGDFMAGSGLREAVAGVDAIIHCANLPQSEPMSGVEGTRSLLQTAHASGSPHFIYISIVGIDRSAYPYYAAKRATEEVIEQGPLPWSIVRTTQFHDFVLNLIQSLGADTQPVVHVADDMRFQSIDVGEVAEKLVALVKDGPAGHAPDMGGPQILTLEEMTKIYLRARGREATVQPETLASGMYDAFRSGINLVPDHTVGTISWEAYLQRLYKLEKPTGV